jgi:hypothetical protein
MVNLDAQRHKTETLDPADRSLDMIGKAVLRLFARCDEHDRILQLYGRRIRALEKAAPALIDAYEVPRIAPSSGRQFRGNRTALWNLKASD